MGLSSMGVPMGTWSPGQSRALVALSRALTACPALQLMQQQTTVLSTSHGSYLGPGVAFSPCHIQQIGAVSLNGLPAAPIAPASGEGAQHGGPKAPHPSGWMRPLWSSSPLAPVRSASLCAAAVALPLIE